MCGLGVFFIYVHYSFQLHFNVLHINMFRNRRDLFILPVAGHATAAPLFFPMLLLSSHGAVETVETNQAGWQPHPSNWMSNPSEQSLCGPARGVTTCPSTTNSNSSNHRPHPCVSSSSLSTACVTPVCPMMTSYCFLIGLQLLLISYHH